MTKLIPIALGAALFAAPLHAADPDSGTLSDDGESIEYTGGPFAAANVFGQFGDPECYDPVFPCDDFALTIDLPDDYSDSYPSALVRIVTRVTSPGADVREDYDVYLYDTAGNIIGEGVSEADPEVIVILAPNGLNDYVIRIVPFTATASTYTTTIELSPGEPAVKSGDASARSGDVVGGSLSLWALLLTAAVARRRVGRTG